MENVLWVALPLIGLTGGFVSGLLGIGGGVIMLPLLTFIGGVPLKLATGTDLVHVWIASAAGLVSHFRVGMVDLKAGFFIGAMGIVGGLAGSFLCVHLGAQTLNAIYLFVVALAIVLSSLPFKPGGKDYRPGDFHRGFGIGMGLGMGVLAGLLGIGGGFIIIPLMTYFIKVPLRIAIGTSLLIIMVSALGTLGAKLMAGHIDFVITLLVVSGSVTGALMGAHISRKTNVVLLRLIFLSLLVTILITVGYKTITLP